MPARIYKSLKPTGGDHGFKHREHRSRKGKIGGDKTKWNCDYSYRRHIRILKMKKEEDDNS